MIAAVIGTFQTAAAAADSPTRETTVSPEGCRVEKYTIASPSMKRDISVLVVLPPEYDADAAKTYPVLYALHGRGAFYTEDATLGVIDLLTWPLSVIWEPDIAEANANRINYTATKEQWMRKQGLGYWPELPCWGCYYR